MLAAEFIQLSATFRQPGADLFSKVSERCINPQRSMRLLIDYRNDAKLRQPRFTFIADVNDHQVMTPRQRLQVVLVPFVDKIRYEDHNAAPTYGIQREG